MCSCLTYDRPGDYENILFNAELSAEAFHRKLFPDARTSELGTEQPKAIIQKAPRRTDEGITKLTPSEVEESTGPDGAHAHSRARKGRRTEPRTCGPASKSDGEASTSRTGIVVISLICAWRSRHISNEM